MWELTPVWYVQQTPANPSSKNKYVYAKHLNFVCIYTRIYVQEAPCQTLHHDSNGSTIYYCTTHTQKVWFVPQVWFILPLIYSTLYCITYCI